MAKELDRLYRRFNEIYFEGKLPRKLKVRWRKKVGKGKCWAITRIPVRGRKGLGIYMSREIQMSPRFVQWILLHELIHVKVLAMKPPSKRASKKRNWHRGAFIKEFRRLVDEGAYDKLV